MKRIVIGLMSGTSMDGIDAAVVEISGSGERTRLRPLEFLTVPYPKATRRSLVSLTGERVPRSGLPEVAELNFRLGELFARAALRAIKQSRRSLKSVSLIGSHGQTLYHGPQDRTRCTLQLGEPAVIAELTGVTTVADFRPADIAAGGEGAPLAPYAHFLLFRSRKHSRAIHNLGGISNLTYLPAGGGPADVCAFDTGPGNMVMDGLVQRMTRGKKKSDRGGAMARRGTVHSGLLRELLRHRFFSLRPPKSTGREDFGGAYIASLVRKAERKGIGSLDLLATATALTAASVGRAYRDHIFPRLGKVDEIYFSGGGRKNRTLMRMLARELDFARVRVVEDLGFNGDALEAQAFAVLANETVDGVPGNLPGVTGARRGLVLGKIVPGKNYLGVKLK